MGVLKAQMPGSEMDARFLTDEEREERQENPPDGLGKASIFCLPTYGSHIDYELTYTCWVMQGFSPCKSQLFCY